MAGQRRGPKGHMLRFAGIALGFAGLPVLVAALLLGDTVHPTTSASAADQVAGDVTCNGTVDAVDALQVLRSVAGLSTNAGCLDDAGDVDCNGDVNSVDALKILRYVAGLPNQYPDGCTHIGEPTVSSDQLIGQALESGEISEEAATVYGVLAEFGDSRLPAKYHGAPSNAPDSDAAMVAATQFASLSPQAQDTLRPFLTPPYAPGSWLDLPTVGGAAAAGPTIDPTQWTTFDAAGGKVKVWARNIYPGELVKAPLVAAAITDTIWPALITLMGEEHAPLSDAGYANNGGDGALDVYLVTIEEEGTMGEAIPYVDMPIDPNTGAAGPCEMTPAYVHVDGGEPLGSATEPGILSTTAHEIFHAFQLSFDLFTNCYYPEYKWFMEASATWAEDYVYPAADAEHEAAGSYLWNPASSLDNAGFFSFGHEYGAYLYPFYFTRKFNSPDLVRTVWEGFTTMNSLPSIDAALAPYGGIEGTWPEFVLHNWNGTTTSWYKDWDGLTDRADLAEPWTLVYPPSGGKPEELKTDVHYTAAKYYSIIFPNWDVFPVRSVLFHNTVAGLPHANVQAITKIGETWQQPEDWTDQGEVVLCRDEDESKRLEEIIIIFSNSDWDTQKDLNPAVQPTIEGSETGCSRWAGEATMTHHRGGEDWTATATGLVFEIPDSNGPNISTTFELKAGTLDLDWQVTAGCTVSGTFHAPVTQEGSGSLTVVHDSVGRRYSASASTYVEGAGACGGFSYSFAGQLEWLLTGPAYQPAPDADHLTGEYTQEGGGPGNEYTRHYQWDFRAVPAEQGVR